PEGLRAANEAAVFKTALPYDSIVMARLSCLYGCPEYIISLRRDGTATYVGLQFTPRTGTWNAELSLQEFGRIAHFIEAHRLSAVMLTDPVVGIHDAWQFRLQLWPTA